MGLLLKRGGRGCPPEFSLLGSKAWWKATVSLVNLVWKAPCDCNSDPEGGPECTRTALLFITVLKIAPQNGCWLMAAMIRGHLVTNAPFISPGSTDHESAEFLLWRNAELWNFLQLLEAARRWQIKEPGAFLSGVFVKILPPPFRPSYCQYEVKDVGEKMMVVLATVCPGDYWMPRGSWQVEETLVEPLTLRTRTED